MVIRYSTPFKKATKKFRHKKKQLRVLVQKIIHDPEIGKPMRYERKHTRELYFGSFRISYYCKDDLLIFLNIYHKDEQ